MKSVLVSSILLALVAIVLWNLLLQKESGVQVPTDNAPPNIPQGHQRDGAQPRIKEKSSTSHLNQWSLDYEIRQWRLSRASFSFHYLHFEKI